MRRIVLWCMSTLSVLVLLFGYHTSTSSTMAAGGGSSYHSSADPGGTHSAGGGTTVTGDVVGTQWGPVQVAITVSGGHITDVSVPQHPSGNSRDTEINDFALPVLVRETLDAQSASIDMVSGATVTSGGYVESLQSALDRAGL